MRYLPIKPFRALNRADSRTITADCFPLQIVPLAARMLLDRTYSASWAKIDHEEGRDAIVRSIVSLYVGCLNPTAEAVDRVYRLLDTAIYGREYVAVSSGSGIVTVQPDIPDVPDNSPFPVRSILGDGKQISLALDNLATGSPNTLYADNRNFRQQLEDIRTALQSGEQLDQEELFNLLGLILGAL